MGAKLAALVVLAAFLAGPAACEGASICFNGWLRLPTYNPWLCSRGSRMRSLPRQRGPYPSGLGLGNGYYDNRWSRSYCPRAEGIVRDAVRDAVAAYPGIGAGLIRLFFHDCFVRGCDASVLLTTTNSNNSDTEREGLPNKNSLRGFEVIDAAKAAIEAACPGKVSCADIVAFAARDASYFLSNRRINIQMPGGRYDGRESFANETDQLPGPFSNVTELQATFAAKGLTSDEMVTLSGAHTIGRARCMFFSSRFSEMDPAFAAKLRAECNGNDDTNVNQDDVTPYVLDKQYYRNVIDRKVLFTSDAVLNSTETMTQVRENANRAGAWERKFERAMENMGKIGIKARADQGAEIRKVCSRVNN
ncbi:peroxidase 2-like [Aegilops tauschii subsp. strangulata]|uniref:Peroxidase n=1 Tax=Aegilops tauschii subsp. strangulata TaxID=200361 RepID=A0A453FLM3_AEGTS|nr:peroxidase 2-like [Aegilops tauschii subsp. strangulata]